MNFKQLRINTLEGGRRTFARFIKAFVKGDVSEAEFKSIVYGMSNYLNWVKAVKDDELETRVTRIEEVISERKDKN